VFKEVSNGVHYELQVKEKVGRDVKSPYLYISQLKIKAMNKKLLAFRLTMITFILLNFLVSFKLETIAECLIMFFTFLLALGYIAAEVISKEKVGSLED